MLFSNDKVMRFPLYSRINSMHVHVIPEYYMCYGTVPYVHQGIFNGKFEFLHGLQYMNEQTSIMTIQMICVLNCTWWKLSFYSICFSRYPTNHSDIMVTTQKNAFIVISCNCISVYFIYWYWYSCRINIQTVVTQF